MKLGKYIKDKGIHTVAIYGMNDRGKRLYDEIKQNGVEVFGIEKLNYAQSSSYKIYLLYEDELPDADMIIVIPNKEFDFIKWELYNFVSETCRIISVQELEQEVAI